MGESSPEPFEPVLDNSFQDATDWTITALANQIADLNTALVIQARAGNTERAEEIQSWIVALGSSKCALQQQLYDAGIPAVIDPRS